MKMNGKKWLSAGAAALAAAVVLTACGAAASDAASGSASAMSGASSGSAAASAAAGTIVKVTPEQGYALLHNDTMDSDNTPVLVDVRTAEEYAEKHIPGALNIPNEEIGTEQPELLPDKATPVMVYCRSGRRSAEAADKLAAMGYTMIYDLGGINDWTYETESGAFDKAAALAALSQNAAASASSAAVAGIAFSGQDIDGNAVDQNVFANADVTMVNIWATYCGPCLSEMPELGELSGEYKDKGVQIIGIVSDVMPAADGSYAEKDVANAKSLIEKTGAAYLHLLPSESIYATMMSDVYAVPTTLFYDKNGSLLGEAYVGSRDKQAWAKILDEMLKKAGGNT